MLTEFEEIELDEILAEEVDKPEDLQEEINNLVTKSTS